MSNEALDLENADIKLNLIDFYNELLEVSEHKKAIQIISEIGGISFEEIETIILKIKSEGVKRN